MYSVVVFSQYYCDSKLGEMNEWRKMTNWELGVRVPLILRAPWLAKSVGVKSNVIVEAVDLFQTIVDLAGLPAPESGANGYPAQNVQGKSFANVLRDPQAAALATAGNTTYAFSQFAKQVKEYGPYGKQPWDPCTKCLRNQWAYMGFSVRNDRWRYTEWFAWDKQREVADWGNFSVGGGPELYDHQGDYGADMDVATDKVNLAHSPKYSSIVAELSEVLKNHFLNDH